jgi:hypothetical protein
LTQGASLLGKRVQYLGDGNLAVGRVAGVVVDRGKILLDLGGSRIALDAVQSLSD